MKDLVFFFSLIIYNCFLNFFTSYMDNLFFFALCSQTQRVSKMKLLSNFESNITTIYIVISICIMQIHILQFKKI